MQIFLLQPDAESTLSKDQIKHLKTLGEVIIQDKIVPFENVPHLMDSKDEKILAVDPDFCDFKISNEVLDKIKNLKAVCLDTTGFSWVDGAHLKSKGIPMTNLRGFSTNAVAEYAIMMALNTARKIPLVIKNNWKMDWGKHLSMELSGKTAGIIGLGRIGKRIAELCQGFGMNVIYWSKNSRDKRFEYRELSDLMKTSDIIFPATAKNEETEKLLTDDMFLSMKRTAIFVAICDMRNHNLLLSLAKEGKIYGYAFEGKDETPMLHEGNVFATPALAWYTDHSLKENIRQWIEAITNAVNGKFENQVNK